MKLQIYDESPRQDFIYKSKLENEAIKELVGNCINIFELVDRYKNSLTILSQCRMTFTGAISNY